MRNWKLKCSQYRPSSHNVKHHESDRSHSGFHRGAPVKYGLKLRTFCVHGMLLTNKPGPYSDFKFRFTRWQLTWISDGESAHPEVLSASSTQLNVVTIVVVHACLGQHSVVLNLTLPATTIKLHWLGEQFAVSIVKLHHYTYSWKKMPKLKINTYTDMTQWTCKFSVSNTEKSQICFKIFMFIFHFKEAHSEQSTKSNFYRLLQNHPAYCGFFKSSFPLQKKNHPTNFWRETSFLKNRSTEWCCPSLLCSTGKFL